MNMHSNDDVFGWCFDSTSTYRALDLHGLSLLRDIRQRRRVGLPSPLILEDARGFRCDDSADETLQQIERHIDPEADAAARQHGSGVDNARLNSLHTRMALRQ